MTAPDQVSPLLAAARQRHDDARRRAVAALRRLDSTGEPINFAAVAREAGVSRAWLYRQDDLRAETERLRDRPSRAKRPNVERASTDSVRQQLEALLALEVELREENLRLREALARKLGEHRAEAAR